MSVLVLLSLVVPVLLKELSQEVTSVLERLVAVSRELLRVTLWVLAIHGVLAT